MIPDETPLGKYFFGSNGAGLMHFFHNRDADNPLFCAGQLSFVLRRRCALPFLRQSGLFLACPSLPDFVCHHRTACGILHPDAEFWQRQRPLLFFRQRWLALLMIARHSVFRPTMASILVLWCGWRFCCPLNRS